MTIFHFLGAEENLDERFDILNRKDGEGKRGGGEVNGAGKMVKMQNGKRSASKTIN